MSAPSTDGPSQPDLAPVGMVRPEGLTIPSWLAVAAVASVLAIGAAHARLEFLATDRSNVLRKLEQISEEQSRIREVLVRICTQQQIEGCGR